MGDWFNQPTDGGLNTGNEPGTKEFQDTCPKCSVKVTTMTYFTYRDSKCFTDEALVELDEHRHRYRPVPVFPKTAWGCIPIATQRYKRDEVVLNCRSNWGEQTPPPQPRNNPNNGRQVGS